MCIQVATLDNWSILARSLFKDDGTIDLDVAAFFLSFIVVVVFVLLPVVAAVYTDCITYTDPLHPCVHAAAHEFCLVCCESPTFVHDACKP